jgi:hypothetical protein
MMRTVSWMSAVLGLLLSSGAGWAADQPAKSGGTGKAPEYQKDIEPILARHCYSCHGEKKTRANLRVDSLAALLKGGNSGPALVPGKSGQSLLVKKADEEDPTPHKGAVLATAQLTLLKTWIDQMAPVAARPAAANDKVIIEVDLDKLPPDLARQLREFLDREKKAKEGGPGK